MQSAAEFRHHMIDGQLSPNRVLDAAVVAAMGITPREAFAPKAYQHAAYLDDAIALGVGGRYLQPPMLVGQMLQQLAPMAGESVLVIGAGTGYMAAVLAQMGLRVFMLESSETLVTQAREALFGLGLTKVDVRLGALEKGLLACAPYDKIVVEGAIHAPSPQWRGQLAPNGVLVYVEFRSFLPLDGKARGVITTARMKDGIAVHAQHDHVACTALSDLMPKEGFHFD